MAAPEPAQPKAPTLSALIQDGWNKADSDPDAALALFKQALAKSSSNAEANLGCGYVLKEKGDPASAKPYLCKAAKSPDSSIQGEAIGMLTAAKLTCL